MKKIILLFLLILNSACGGGITIEESPSLQIGAVTLNAYQLPGAFPVDVIIPNIAGMENTAFVLDFDTTSVLPIDLDRSPLVLSENFPIFDGGAAGLSSPTDLFILSSTQAFLLTSQHLLYFDPSTGQERTRLDLGEAIVLEQALPYSKSADCDDDGSVENQVPAGAFTPTFPSQVVATMDQVLVSFANLLCFGEDFNSIYTNGMLLAWELIPSEPYLSPASEGPIVLEGFNATGLTLLEDQIIATTTGDTVLQGAVNEPETESFLNIIKLSDLSLQASLNLGLVAVNFRALAVDLNNDQAWIGSSRYSEVYQINLEDFSLRSTVPFSTASGDYINDQVFDARRGLLFVSSFGQSLVKVLDLNQGLSFLPDVFDFSFNEPGTTGAGPLALRPGLAGQDFTGAELWVLTGNGTLSSAQTDSTPIQE